VPDALAELLGLVGAGTISRNQARDVLAEALQAGTRPRAIVDEQGLAQVSDESALARAVDDVLAAHTDEVDRFRAGDDKERKKLRGFLMGQAMKALGGQGNPQVLSRILDERLGEAR
jgi:aspartyl-tRNA(Asn)/glutamyl-tRNA(Gln) amidotransferase subunit B